MNQLVLVVKIKRGQNTALSHVKKTGKNRIFVDFFMIKNRLKWDDYNQILIRFIIRKKLIKIE